MSRSILFGGSSDARRRRHSSQAGTTAWRAHEPSVQRDAEDAGQLAVQCSGCVVHLQCMTDTIAATDTIEIIGGPTPIQAPRVGSTYRWKVQHGSAEKHVYVQIADSMRAEYFDEPLRSGIESKGESVLRKLLERGSIPTRIKITSAGITEVGVDRRPRPCSF
jgi:hypothetical protein